MEEERGGNGGAGQAGRQSMPGLSRVSELASSSFARRGCHLTPFGSSCHAREQC